MISVGKQNSLLRTQGESQLRLSVVLKCHGVCSFSWQYWVQIGLYYLPVKRKFYVATKRWKNKRIKLPLKKKLDAERILAENF